MIIVPSHPARLPAGAGMDSKLKRGRLVALTLALAAAAALAPATRAAPSDAAAATSRAESDAEAAHPDPQRRGGFGQARGVYKAQITPHWLTNSSRFWYRNDLRGGAKEFILVDADKGTRQPAFDHRKLAAVLSKAAGQEYTADKLPFSEIEFVEGGNAIRFEANDKTWKCDLKSYECTEVKTSAANSPRPTMEGQFLSADSAADDAAGTAPEASYAEEELPPQADTPQQNESQQTGQRRGRGQRQGQNQDLNQGQGQRGQRGARPATSPDGKWRAFVRDQNVFVRSEADDTEFQLSEDGKEGNAYGRLLEWSPDSKTLVAWRTEPGDIGDVYLVQSSPQGGGRARLRTRPYAQAGDRFPRYELNVFDVATRKQTKPEVDRFEHEWLTPNLHWAKDQVHFTYSQEDRGHQRMRLIEVDARTGAVRNLVDEKTKTFIWTAHMEGPQRLGVRNFIPLENSDEIIHASERDGWRHLYLVDPQTGGIRNQITKGEWVVRGVNHIDEERRQIWFLASGRNPGQDPYFNHYYRINFDGTGLVALTAGNGNHTAQFSPDRKFLIDTYSRADQPPVHELRRCSDGALVCKLEETDIAELKATGWEPPEVFVAKGRDDQTDIWGLISRPRNLDPNRKYPILEDIYGGPQDSYTPKSFSGANRYQRYTDLGFVVVKLDGMGTANRSKAFHDVCWHNLKDGGFPDRIKWIQAAGARYSYLDLTRVGIYGTSAGGQNAAAAVLFHPEFYKAAVANSGCHDNRLDKASWNEQWMGYLPPDKIWSTDEDNWYSQSSNIDNAAKLKGRLLLIVGEMDSNVPPESTMRFVDALIRARKDFDLLVVPGANHGAGSPVTQLRTQNFFIRHLQGIEPPNPNAEGEAGGS